VNDALATLLVIHAALVRVHDCLDRLEESEGWRSDFLRSLDRQLHRGRTLTKKQSAAPAPHPQGLLSAHSSDR
jgi:hypothetical protein